MGRPPRLRAFAALALAAGLLLLSRAPLCASEACPMSKSARAACRQLGLDCCKGAGERLAHSSPQPQVPDLFLSPAVRLVAAAPVGALAAPRRPAPLPSAVLQGVGLHTLFAVFLI